MHVYSGNISPSITLLGFLLHNFRECLQSCVPFRQLHADSAHPEPHCRHERLYFESPEEMLQRFPQFPFIKVKFPKSNVSIVKLAIGEFKRSFKVLGILRQISQCSVHPRCFFLSKASTDHFLGFAFLSCNTVTLYDIIPEFQLFKYLSSASDDANLGIPLRQIAQHIPTRRIHNPMQVPKTVLRRSRVLLHRFERGLRQRKPVGMLIGQRLDLQYGAFSPVSALAFEPRSFEQCRRVHHPVVVLV
mmetsp:Transcript_4095/g.9196  ORF Transcript_4095/g.9196 Transcript_4095/m.9196 type:complete len:246 (+) Transcript_4095:747-1484(+)